MKLNANIPALQAVRHMNKTNGKITDALSKLSSGYKINTVGDDPSGTAVSNKIKAQLNGLKKAEKNSLDGVSLLQTAEGAMAEVHEMLKRMRELSVQSANDTNAPDDRMKIQMEIDQLVDSIDQMADVTEFNQLKLLNGSLSNLTTVYSNSTMQISRDLSIKYMTPNFPLGDYSIEVLDSFSCASITAEYKLGEGEILLNSDKIEIAASDTQAEIEAKILEMAGRYDCDVDFSSRPSFTMISKEAGSQVKLELDGTGLNVSPPNTLPIFGQGVSAKIELTSGFSNTATYKVAGNRVTIYEKDGNEIQIDLNKLGKKGEYTIKIEDKGQLKLQVGANEDQRIALMIPGLSTYSLGLKKQSFSQPILDEIESVNLINVKNVHGAERSIGLLDDAVAKVSNMRASLGAYQNRLEHTVTSVQANSTNTEESLSRIQDTDMALEMSNYTLNNVILQSSIAMLAQANERPQQLLQLLR